MALQGTNTLVTLNDELQIFCNSHKQIKRYAFEFEEQLENLSTEGKTFPLVFAIPTTFNKNGMTDIHTVRIYVLNRANRNRDNTLDNINDTSLILNDIIKYWNSSNRNSDILLDNEPFAQAVNNTNLDYLQGYYADFDFELKSYSRCSIPIPDGIPVVVPDGNSFIDPYLTCGTLDDCSVFTASIYNLQNQINNLDAEKWTFGVDLDDTYLDFTRNDGSTYSVDLQPLITDLENDVATNTNDIGINTININGNGNDISNLELDLAGATNSILTNTNDIATNQTDIGDNLTLINTNIIDISNLELDLLNYLPLSGGQITGDLSVTGDFEVLGTTTTIGTQTIQALDNNFTLNYGGTHLSADGGGITIQDGVSAGNDSSWLINSDGNWYTNQSVGIRTDDPQKELDVRGDLILGEIAPNQPNRTLTVTGYNDCGINLNNHGNWTNWQIRTGLGNLTIENLGNSNKSQTIEIGDITEGTAEILFRTNNASFFSIGTNTGSSATKFGVLNPNNNFTGDFYIDTAFGVQDYKRFIFKNTGELDTGAVVATDATLDSSFAGNVGIGTNTPSTELQVLSDSFTVADFTRTASLNPSIRLSNVDDGGLMNIGAISNGDGYITPTSGRLGIGTTTPQTELDVDGEITVGIERWTIDLMAATTKVIYASESLSITVVEDIVNAPTTTILLNGSAYTLGDPIISGDKIDIIVSTASVIKLKIEK